MSAESGAARRFVRAAAMLLGLVLADPIGLAGRQPAGEPDRLRADQAFAEALARCTEWLGANPAGVPKGIDVDAPWRAAPATLDVEAQVAFGVARSWWPQQAADPVSQAIVDGAAWYLQSRIVERLFEQRFGHEGYRRESVRFFGGAWPWSFDALTVSRWTAGLGRSDYLNATAGAERAAGALAFGTLERYLTWPVLQGSLQAWVRRAANERLTASDIAATIGEAAGQDLSWFFNQAFDARKRFDYGLVAFTSQPGGTCDGAPCYRTRVTVAARGDGLFTGTSQLPAGSFDAGDAMVLRIMFSDGRVSTERWDGRAASRVFELESTAEAIGAWLDPDGTLLLDRNHLDDRMVTSPPVATPLGKWLARWTIWLQDAMLSYGSLV
jgi:hypothetical protein